MGDLIYDANMYDGLNTKLADLAFYKQWLPKNKDATILELCCGTGRLTIPIAKDGYNISRVDFTASMLKQAKEKASKEGVAIEFIDADIRTLDLSVKYDLIFIQFNSIHHLYKNEDLFKALKVVKNHLKEGGLFLLDCFNPNMQLIVDGEKKPKKIAAYTTKDGREVVLKQLMRYENKKNFYDLPASIDKETVHQLREYFLNYLYPANDKRAALNEAFNSLDDYTKHPHKLLRILLDAAKLIFGYGRHLPKILQAGLNAMKTFKAASNFENNLVNEAIKNEIDAPYDLVKIDALIKLLSREEIEKFIESSQSLFEILHDKVLIKKIKEVIKHLIAAMRKNENSYSQSQIKGLEIGLEMITEGDALFNRLSTEDQKNLVLVISEIERDNLDYIF